MVARNLQSSLQATMGGNVGNIRRDLVCVTVTTSPTIAASSFSPSRKPTPPLPASLPKHTSRSNMAQAARIFLQA
ncbi:hypothetical protein Naga_100305g4 [Nannochloropsis gaditana]|uniref:Uncharacterized protein n=1 Tax=Nannochloropsis gaditana TaxID=72520 RepID=W7U932_9STRA|nr:hypothetical protein Naga_100305g4 [Nannochloropsis gaditana]